jgi:hypothetical protein
MAGRDDVRQQERQIKVQIKSVKEEVMALKQQLKRPAKDLKEVGYKVISTIFFDSVSFLGHHLNPLSNPTSLAQKERNQLSSASKTARDSVKH